MPTPALHPLDARFLKLALVQQLLSPGQARRAEESFHRRLRRGLAVTIEQVLQEEGYLTDAECQSLWDLFAQGTDTHAREQIAQRREGIEVPTTEAPAIPHDIGHLPDLGAAYQILGLIGRGGMGTVFRARQLNMDREVALKVLRPDLTTNARYIRRFIREARAAGQLDHPNLVRVYDVGEAGSGGWFISMEYVEGRTVRYLLRREGRLNLLDSLKILAQVTAALECAHRSKIIHRDIKPDNIMITSRGVAKLCDLGLAKALEGPLQDTDTQEGSTLGTPHYMSPEQAQGQPVDERSDLFSLGATLYHMVTGRVPFEGPSALEVMLKVSAHDPVPPEQIEPLLPPPVCNMIRRLMARDPKRRPASAVAVQRELEELCRDLASGRVFAYEDQIRLAPASPTVWPPRERNWAMGLTGAVLFLVLCIGLRAFRGEARIPPVVPPVFLADALQKTHASDPTREPTPAVAKNTAPIQQAAPGLPDAELLALERRLARGDDWPAVLAEVERWAQAHGSARPQDRSRLDALRENLAAACAADANAEWARRLPAARAFAEAAQFSSAEALLNAAPAPLRPALEERRAMEEARMKREAQEWTARSRELFDALLKKGHLRLADAWLESWKDLLSSDGAPLDDPRRTAWRELADVCTREAKLRQEREKEAARIREQAQRKLVEIRAESLRHDLAKALSLCEKALAAAQGEGETALLKAERERLTRVQRLFLSLAEALTNHKRRISEKDFRPGETVTGLVVGMNDRHLIVEVPHATNRSEANIPLNSISRAEMRALIEQVVSREFAADDPVARLAYDLEDPAMDARAALYANLENSNPRDQAWLQLVLSAERAERRWTAEQELDEAEALCVKERYIEALWSLASAREALGSEPDAQMYGQLNERLRSLLVLVAEAEMRSHLLKKDSSAADLSACAWHPVVPRVTQGGLAFGSNAAEAELAWRLLGRARLEVELALPATGRGSFSLALTAAPRAWAVLVTTEEGRATAALECSGVPAPAWSTEALSGARGRVRIWMETDVGRLSWGADGRTLGTYLTEPQGEWQVRLKGQGAMILYGLRVQGAFGTAVAPDDRAGEALLKAILDKPEGLRLRALLDIRLSPLLSLPQRARCYAAIADENSVLGTNRDAHAWNALALFACPAEQLPEEIRARAADHKKRQERREREGRTPPDLRKL